MNVKKGLLTLFACLLSGASFAATEGMPLAHATVNVSDKATLQRGAKYYMNYCSGCHSLKYMRYERMATDLGLTTFDGSLDKDLLFNNLVFTEALPGDPIQVAMPAVDSREWFGATPPDLSLVSRVRGADWIFTYLKSFYLDADKPFHTNNMLFPDVAMPNVLAPLQGLQVPVYVEKAYENNGKTRIETVLDHLQIVEAGEMSEHQFNAVLNDIVSFLVYVGEPAKLVRYQMGYWVLGFLLVLLVLCYLLKKEFWKDIH